MKLVHMKFLKFTTFFHFPNSLKILVKIYSKPFFLNEVEKFNTNKKIHFFLCKNFVNLYEIDPRKRKTFPQYWSQTRISCKNDFFYIYLVKKCVLESKRKIYSTLGKEKKINLQKRITNDKYICVNVYENVSYVHYRYEAKKMYACAIFHMNFKVQKR